ncbi:MAG TPA: glycogen synthase, partial [Gemmataceae bacterium]|nr:glycogen synthase [Gemmataceae bacterium]
MTVQSPRILFAASEVVGFAKTGGLADVAGSLPRALAKRGLDIAVVLPLYHTVRTGPHRLTPTDIVFTVLLGQRSVHGRLWRTTLPDSDVPVYLVEHPELFERDDPHQGRGLYQYTGPDGRKHDYPDNADRFIVFSRAIMETLPRLGAKYDVLHCNDWQTGLMPCYLRELYGRQSHTNARAYAGLHTLMTVHNIAYQGSFPATVMPHTGLSQRLFNHRQLEFYGRLNFLKTGCVFADRISTVSPRYAEEIQTPEFGCGLEGVLTERHGVLSGIVNGVDYESWNPATDPHLAATYDVDTVFDRKPANKSALQAEYDLPRRPEPPLFGMVARLVEQKGISLLVQSAKELLAQDMQIVILGEGDPGVHKQLTALHEQFPHKLGLRIGFDEGLAHRIEGGADAFLMPSQFEPSGLNQLYSLRYGTVPVVRA